MCSVRGQKLAAAAPLVLAFVSPLESVLVLPEHRTNAHRLWLLCPAPHMDGKADWTWSQLPSLCFPLHPPVDPLHYFCSCSVAVPTLLGSFFLCCLKGTCLPSPVWRFFLTQAPSVQQPTLCISLSVLPFCPSYCDSYPDEPL